MSDDSLSEEDKALFRRIMSDVKPLKKGKPPKAASTPKMPQIHRQKPDIVAPKVPSIFLSDYYAEAVQADTILTYCSHSIPNKRMRELKMGQIPWQAKLDLHGLRPDDAREALIEFLMQQTKLTHRSILIIHGKGSHQGEAPILKNLVNHWLPQFPQVLAFHSALARDGGGGALYVLLKRQRKERN